ncbi:MAG: LPS biosynthesis sugar transferase [Aequorivita sp.]|nr:LPS biosynthesis sugar transferase [Aequorivita sp.]MBF30632.1 LPS biosynthesis sugar transferase [Aequorivita sp.]|tara:strand:- start:27426 stop:28037 length:612 start_codon:yes stop_codon:yes gene_type:complete
MLSLLNESQNILFSKRNNFKVQQPIKKIFDIAFSIIGLLIFGWLILLLLLFAYFDTGKALFCQPRVGQYGKQFTIFKIRTLQTCCGSVSKYGKFLRRSKLDELPQLLNILLGQMSFVGPRPDIPGYYDKLEGEDRKILELKPGLISKAALKYYNEEALLKQQTDPLKYNDEVIFPDKVRMNLDYYYNRSFAEDLRIMWLFFTK